jgi:hypothetical protein
MDQEQLLVGKAIKILARTVDWSYSIGFVLTTRAYQKPI